MDRQQCEAIVDAVEAAFRAIDVELYPGAKLAKDWIDERYEYLEASQSRERLLAFFNGCADANDPKAQELLLFITAAPAILKKFVHGLVKQAGDAIPTPSGRPTALTSETKREIIETVSQLHRRKVRMGDAHARAALKCGVSKRTAQRVWQERDSIEAHPYQTINDLLKFFSPSRTTAKVSTLPAQQSISHA